MVCPSRRGRWFWLALIGTPGLGWVLIVFLIPTGWVKGRLTERLAAETGRSVQIGSVRLGLLGDLKIRDLCLAERSTPTDPWLRVGEAVINVNPVRVVFGCCQPSVVGIENAEIRVHRRVDGSYEFGELARSRTSGFASVGSATPLADSPAIQLRVANSTIRLIDEAAQIRLILSNVQAQAAYQPRIVELKSVEGLLNGGTFKMAARLQRDPSVPQFSAEVRVNQARLDRGLNMVGKFVPLIARDEAPINGRLNLRLAVHGQGATSNEIQRTVTGQGSILLDPIDLVGSRLLTELKTLGEWPDENHVGAVSSNFSIDHRRVTTEDLTIRAARLPFVVAGWTDFDGQFEYGTRVDQMIAGLPREARSILGDAKSSLDELAGLRIKGNPDQAQWTYHGRPLSGDLGQSNTEHVRFRESARKIRDRFFR